MKNWTNAKLGLNLVAKILKKIVCITYKWPRPPCNFIVWHYECFIGMCYTSTINLITYLWLLHPGADNLDFKLKQKYFHWIAGDFDKLWSLSVLIVSAVVLSNCDMLWSGSSLINALSNLWKTTFKGGVLMV